MARPFPNSPPFSSSGAFQLTDVHVIGDHRVLLSRGAVVEPGVVLDTRGGPILLAEDTRIEGPARITGPFYLGPGSTVLGGAVGLSSIGPACKIRGEVTDSIFLGFSNKAHDGHIGHAVLGRWVNLGAGTINSDLKNTYSSVRLRLADGEVDTGLTKCGSFIGDHVKTGIGTLLNTGTVIGAASNVFGGGMPPMCVPAFSWGEGDRLGEYRADKFFATAAIAMRRRGVELSEGMRHVLGRAAERARNQRGAGRNQEKPTR
jgi:UDP-N-acetylglucosamine diphosphorylase/glucosamine-1-phosphate N-acetyltransferase